jgi:hypothetical protein
VVLWGHILDLRVAVHANGDLDVTAGTTNTKGVMPWNEPGSSFVAGHKNLALHVRLDPDGAATVRLVA